MVNPLVPDWLIVILLTVVLLLLASRVTVKAIRMRAAETALLSGRATANLDPSASSAKALAGTPFAAIPEVEPLCLQLYAILIVRASKPSPCFLSPHPAELLLAC